MGTALERLEFIADTFLSVATPVQLALPELLRTGAVVRAAIAARCRGNLAGLRAAAPVCPACRCCRSTAAGARYCASRR